MKRSHWLSISTMCFTCLLFSCSKPLPELKNIDLKSWRADVNGCQGRRRDMLPALDDQKKLLLGLDEMQLVSILGKPDRYEIYKRNQKFYYYFLEASPECTTPMDHAKQLTIRFNAVGLANEAEVE